MTGLNKNTVIMSITVVLLGMGLTFYAQEGGNWQTTLFFEDAIGNRDSVIIGLHPNATQGTDLELGEVKITTPFDSVFEVRVGSIFEDELYKINIADAPYIPNWGCYSAGGVFIYLWSKYPPVTMSWDKDHFLSDPCIRGTYVDNHILDGVSIPDFHNYPGTYYCMADVNTGIFDSLEISIGSGNEFEFEVLGLGKQIIPFLEISYNLTTHFDTPCYYVVEAYEAPPQGKKISIFPNPALDELNIEVETGLNVTKVEVYNVQGQLTRTYYNQQILEVSSLSKGMYLIKVQDSKNKVYSSKFIKME